MRISIGVEAVSECDKIKAGWVAVWRPETMQSDEFPARIT